MALSNIFREPRREITESVAGILVVFGLLFADYRFGRWWQQCLESSGAHHPGYWDGFWILGMIAGVVLLVMMFAVTTFSHFVGEEICDFLARRGLELRPKQRYR